MVGPVHDVVGAETLNQDVDNTRIEHQGINPQVANEGIQSGFVLIRAAMYRRRGWVNAKLPQP